MIHSKQMGIRGAAVALSLLTVVATAGTSCDAQVNGTDTNVQVVKDFIASWSDPDKSATYLAADAAVRLSEDQPPVIGPGPYVAAAKGFATQGETFSVKILTTFARGPVVVNSRIDTLKTPGKPDQAFKIVGVFVVKGGKIKEWTDYLDK